MTRTNRPMRADARRNRDAILAASGALFAERGTSVSMDEIAERSGLGIGTLYRHFATKQALLAAIVARRFQEMSHLARAAAQVDNPGTAFETLLRSYLEAAERDAAFRLVLLGPEQPDWAELTESKREFVDAALPVIARAIEAGQLPADFGFGDFVLATRGVMANMTGDGDWRRHLDLTVRGLR